MRLQYNGDNGDDAKKKKNHFVCTLVVEKTLKNITRLTLFLRVRTADTRIANTYSHTPARQVTSLSSRLSRFQGGTISFDENDRGRHVDGRLFERRGEVTLTVRKRYAALRIDDFTFV